jgi:HEPN domain-containing protein
MGYARDANHWLYRFSPEEWIRAALGELRRAEEAYKKRDTRGGLAGCRRAAGMALNAALIAEPKDWGRTYVDHLRALVHDRAVPEQVRASCKLLLDTQPPGHELVFLRSKEQDERVLEAARDVMAHGYAVVKRHETI